MEHLAPLIQTILWVVLIAVLAWRFYEPLYGILVALKKRIEEGGTIKAGPFELTEKILVPQNLNNQRKKIESEIKELLATQSNIQSESQSIPKSSIQSRYLQAEDMALRALQAEFQVPISRQVTTSAEDVRFDGVFSMGETLYIVEVKYSFHLITAQVITETIERIRSVIKKYRWKNINILIAFVYEDPPGIEVNSKELNDIIIKYSIPIDIRTYSYSELENKFSVSNNII